MKVKWLNSSAVLSWMYWFMSSSSTATASAYAGLPLPPGTSLSWMPASSLYCCQRSVSISSAAARNRRIAASPFVRPPFGPPFGRGLASASDGSSNRPPAPRLAAPTAAPFSRKERRLVTSCDWSLASIIFSSRSAPSRAGGPRGLVSFHVRDRRRVFHPRERQTSIAASGKLAIPANGYPVQARPEAPARDRQPLRASRQGRLMLFRSLRGGFL